MNYSLTCDFNSLKIDEFDDPWINESMTLQRRIGFTVERTFVVCRVVDAASNIAADVLQRILPDIGRRRYGKDALGGRGHQVDDGQRRSTRARRSDIRACQSGKQLLRDAERRYRLPVWRTHQFPVLRAAADADKLDAAARRQQSSDASAQRRREIGLLLHAAVRASSRHRHRRRRLVAEVCAVERRPSPGKWCRNFGAFCC